MAKSTFFPLQKPAPFSNPFQHPSHVVRMTLHGDFLSKRHGRRTGRGELAVGRQPLGPMTWRPRMTFEVYTLVIRYILNMSIFWLIYPLKVVISHSYVSLLEGMVYGRSIHNSEGFQANS